MGGEREGTWAASANVHTLRTDAGLSACAHEYPNLVRISVFL